MRTLTKRIGELENRLGIAPGQRKLLLVVSTWRNAHDVDRCVDILREYGFLPTGPGIGMVDLIDLPKGLNAEELKSFLREHGASICGHKGAPIWGLQALIQRNEPAK